MQRSMFPFVVLVCAIGVSTVVSQINYLNPKQKLTASGCRTLGAASNTARFNRTLEAICVPRVVGTAGHERVRDFIVADLRSLGLAVQLDAFDAQAPTVGRVRFTNIIGRLDPNATRFLTLACHYDSKYFAPGSREAGFVGAVDSAVPCSMMLDVVRTLKLAANADRDVSLMLLFFDGEEAFAEWTDEDSLYGSRHLAQRLPDVERIDALVLLDLIGAPRPVFLNYYAATVPLFQRMVELERMLFAAGEMRGQRYMFRPRNSNSRIADDHLPFAEMGVPIVHLITNPFPKHWHKIGDNLQNLDFSVIENFNKILRCFTYEYLMASRAVNFRLYG